jgi:hypothetical protein
MKNLAFILPNGHIIAFGKEPTVQLYDIGCKGTNNYSLMWRENRIYHNGKINIIDIPVVVISPDHNEKYQKRKTKTIELLTKMGFKSITHYKSSDQYPKCLVQANIDILSQHLDDNPLLIVEDDINCTDILDVDIPNNADCHYVGFSVHAAHPTENVNYGPCKTTKITENIHRILNMLSMHAIIYISKRFKEATIQCFNNNTHTDICLARIQSTFNVYANSTPIFYQDDEFNVENSKATLMRLN